jgi:hypothetical protein
MKAKLTRYAAPQVAIFALLDYATTTMPSSGRGINRPKFVAAGAGTGAAD